MTIEKADLVATMVLSQLEGALLLARTYRSLEPMRRAEQAIKLLRQVTEIASNHFYVIAGRIGKAIDQFALIPAPYRRAFAFEHGQRPCHTLWSP